MEFLTPNRLREFFLLLSLTFLTTLNAQVGIGNTNPNSNSLLEIGNGLDTQGLLLPRVNLTGTANATPLSGHIMGMIVYNKNTAGDVSPGIYYNNGIAWIQLAKSVTTTEPAINSVSLATNHTFNSTGYTDIPGMTITFTAWKSSALIQLTASGYGSINSTSIAYLRIYNTTNASVIGGTMEKVQTYIKSGPIDLWMTTWSSAYSKLITGLVIGNTYSIKVQGFGQQVSSGASVVINPISEPNSNHLTLSVIQ